MKLKEFAYLLEALNDSLDNIVFKSNQATFNKAIDMLSSMKRVKELKMMARELSEFIKKAKMNAPIQTKYFGFIEQDRGFNISDFMKRLNYIKSHLRDHEEEI